jgi:hypothetical protein
VRLDHLLSKERLPAKVGWSPCPASVGVGCSIGGDTGELAAGNGWFLLVQPSFGVVGAWGLVRLVVGVQ